MSKSVLFPALKGEVSELKGITKKGGKNKKGEKMKKLFALKV